MNLFELIRKKQRHVVVEAWDAASKTYRADPDADRFLLTMKLEAEDAGPPFEGIVRGLGVLSGIRITVRNAARHFPRFAAGGGLLYALHRTLAPAYIDLGWARNGQSLLSQRFTLSRRLAELDFPASPEPEADLVVEVPPQTGVKVFIGVHKALDRRVLYRECVGRGLEIGPGPKPQILKNDKTDVRYLEQATPDEWHKLYGADSIVPVDPETWNLYVVGNANDIPADQTDLDFIFSSHVVEHLANPLGHLEYWGTRLRPGGVVAAVIPDREGCKDFVFDDSTVEELEKELEDGDFDVKLHHYARWGKHRMLGVAAEEIMGTGRSIHVHYYTARSMAAVLERNYERLGFTECWVTASHNHKDFFVLLRK